MFWGVMATRYGRNALTFQKNLLRSSSGYNSHSLENLRTNKCVFSDSFTHSANSIHLIPFSLINRVIKSASEDPCYDNFSNFNYFHFLTYTKFHKRPISSTKLKICGHFHEVKKGAKGGTFTSEP